MFCLHSLSQYSCRLAFTTRAQPCWTDSPGGVPSNVHEHISSSLSCLAGRDQVICQGFGHVKSGSCFGKQTAQGVRCMLGAASGQSWHGQHPAIPCDGMATMKLLSKTPDVGCAGPGQNWRRDSRLPGNPMVRGLPSWSRRSSWHSRCLRWLLAFLLQFPTLLPAWYASLPR